MPFPSDLFCMAQTFPFISFVHYQWLAVQNSKSEPYIHIVWRPDLGNLSLDSCFSSHRSAFMFLESYFCPFNRLEREIDCIQPLWTNERLKCINRFSFPLMSFPLSAAHKRFLVQRLERDIQVNHTFEKVDRWEEIHSTLFLCNLFQLLEPIHSRQKSIQELVHDLCFIPLSSLAPREGKPER